jgi:hypothetical protein
VTPTLSYKEKAVYWIIDFEIPNFISAFGREELDGRILIASRQLWSLLKGDQVVRSALIGPGYVKGEIKKATGKVDFGEPISAVIFDPTELRIKEPLPLVNIFSPEVIDPLEESSKQEIESVVSKIMLAKGRPLVQEKLAEVKSLTSLPTLEYSTTSKVKLQIALTSGLSKARFALSGVHKRIYSPYVSKFLDKKRNFGDVNSLNIFWVDKRRLIAPSEEVLSEWTIIEQNSGMAESEENIKDGYKQIVNEYNRTLDFMKANIDSYILK